MPLIDSLNNSLQVGNSFELSDWGFKSCQSLMGTLLDKTRLFENTPVSPAVIACLVSNNPLEMKHLMNIDLVTVGVYKGRKAAATESQGR